MHETAYSNKGSPLGIQNWITNFCLETGKGIAIPFLGAIVEYG